MIDNRWLHFNEKWFKKNQNVLLKRINNKLIGPYVRQLLNIEDEYDYIYGITPHSLIVDRRIEDGQIIEKQVFRTHQKYSKRVYFAMKELWQLCHWFDMQIANRFAPKLNLGFDTLVVYPQTGGGGSNVTSDGIISHTASFTGVSYNSTSWNSLRNATTGSNAYPSTGSMGGSSGNSVLALYYTEWNFYIIRFGRSIFSFDTSMIPLEANINSTELGLYVYTSTQVPNGFLCMTNATHITAYRPIYISSMNFSNNNNVTTTDYNITRYGSTSYAVLDGPSGTNQYNTLTFNSAGIEHIQKGGITGLSLRSHIDFNGIVWLAASNNQSHSIIYNIRFADTTGTTQDPKLTVEYSLPAKNKIVMLP